MSGKLDQSLDEILSTRRKSATGRGGRGRRVPNSGRKATIPPVGGVGKKTHLVGRAAVKGSAPSGPASGLGSKIIVSNLPPDVNEDQIKEYFVKSVGTVKRVTITYGPNGVSRGIATIIFVKPGSANDAAIKLNGLLVDKRPMKIEVVLDASKAPPPEPVRGMGDRITNPKAQPKRATAAKADSGATRGRGARGRTGGRGGTREKRGKPKTADELDAEMTDYFVANGTNGPDDAASGDAPAAGGDDLGMDGIS